MKLEQLFISSSDLRPRIFNEYLADSVESDEYSRVKPSGAGLKALYETRPTHSSYHSFEKIKQALGEKAVETLTELNLISWVRLTILCDRCQDAKDDLYTLIENLALDSMTDHNTRTYVYYFLRSQNRQDPSLFTSDTSKSIIDIILNSQDEAPWAVLLTDSFWINHAVNVTADKFFTREARIDTAAACISSVMDRIIKNQAHTKHIIAYWVSLTDNDINKKIVAELLEKTEENQCSLQTLRSLLELIPEVSGNELLEIIFLHRNIISYPEQGREAIQKAMQSLVANFSDAEEVFAPQAVFNEFIAPVFEQYPELVYAVPRELLAYCDHAPESFKNLALIQDLMTVKNLTQQPFAEVTESMVDAIKSAKPARDSVTDPFRARFAELLKNKKLQNATDASNTFLPKHFPSFEELKSAKHDFSSQVIKEIDQLYTDIVALSERQKNLFRRVADVTLMKFLVCRLMFQFFDEAKPKTQTKIAARKLSGIFTSSNPDFKLEFLLFVLKSLCLDESLGQYKDSKWSFVFDAYRESRTCPSTALSLIEQATLPKLFMEQVLRSKRTKTVLQLFQRELLNNMFNNTHFLGEILAEAAISTRSPKNYTAGTSALYAPGEKASTAATPGVKPKK